MMTEWFRQTAPPSSQDLDPNQSCDTMIFPLFTLRVPTKGRQSPIDVKQKYCDNVEKAY